jgi:uncharacterized protein YyaL (SSP411 family)
MRHFEERPDIDLVYMTVCQIMTGSGGWPLTIIMTPDKEPFFASTYISKETRFGRMGMLELIPRIKELWLTRQADVLSSAYQIIGALQQTSVDLPGEELSEPILHLAYKQFAGRFNERYGGFGNVPKFPSPHNLLFLLRYWKRTGEGNALYMVEKTLQAMRYGGIYDHIGFGFHRYSTDAQWLIPHFEKMLYDQAMIAMVYTEAYQATGKEEFARTAHEIFSYVLRDMTSPEGGFYSAEDADSEGEEGKFYLWTRDEVQKILSREEAEVAIKVFNIREDGNFASHVVGMKKGNNILHLTESWTESASHLSMSLPVLKKHMESIRQKMFAYRKKRIYPHKDDKILTTWNGLMIAALAKGAQVFNEPRYATAASRAADFVLNNLTMPDGRLIHRYRDGQAALPAHVDDYAFLIWAMLELYETTFDVNYIHRALEVNRDLIDHFWDDNYGGFYFTADDSEGLLLRQKEIFDGATPSGNSVAMLNLLRLGRLTANAGFEQKASRIGRAFSGNVSQSPSSYAQLMVALDFALGPSFEVVIAGDSQTNDTQEMLRVIRGRFIPNKVIILRSTEQSLPEIDNIATFIRNHSSIDGKATVYICSNYDCRLPTSDIDTMLRLLNSK